MIGVMRCQFPLAVALASEDPLGTHHPHWFRVVDGEWEAFGIPKLELVGLVPAFLKLLSEIGWDAVPNSRVSLAQLPFPEHRHRVEAGYPDTQIPSTPRFAEALVTGGRSSQGSNPSFIGRIVKKEARWM